MVQPHTEIAVIRRLWPTVDGQWMAADGQGRVFALPGRSDYPPGRRVRLRRDALGKWSLAS